MADGISAVDIGMLLFDVEPKPAARPRRGALGRRRRPPRGWPSPAARSPGSPRRCAGSARWLRRAAAASRPRPQARQRRPRRPLGGDLEPGAAGAAVPLNTGVGPGRSFCWASFELADFKRLKNALGGTVNDVSLAVAAGALRRWLRERGSADEGLELKALVPVSIRTEDEHGELGNRLTAMRGPAPGRRRRPGRAAARRRRRDGRAQGLQAAARRRSDLGAERLVPRLRAAVPARPDRGDQLLDPALQPARHQLPRPADPLLRARPRADRRSTRSASSPAATRSRSRSSATTARSASASSPTRARCPTPNASPPTSVPRVEELRAAAADSLRRRWRRAGRR